jgi:hypothetical protein
MTEAAQLRPPYFWSRLGISQNSLLQPEHRKMAIAPSGQATASMNVIDLLHAAQSGSCLVSRSVIPHNAGTADEVSIVLEAQGAR